MLRRGRLLEIYLLLLIFAIVVLGLGVRRALDGGRLLGVGNLGLLKTLDDLVELFVGIRVDVLLAGDRLAQRESRANDRLGLLVVALGSGQLAELVLLARQMVLVGVFAVEGLLAGGAGLFEVGLVSFRCRSGSGLQDFVGKNFGRDGRQGSDAALEVVSATGETRLVVGHKRPS